MSISEILNFTIPLTENLRQNTHQRFLIGNHNSSSSRTEITDYQKKAWFWTLITHFLDIKKIVNGQKVGNLFVFKLKNMAELL